MAETQSRYAIIEGLTMRKIHCKDNISKNISDGEALKLQHKRRGEDLALALQRLDEENNSYNEEIEELDKGIAAIKEISKESSQAQSDKKI